MSSTARGGLGVPTPTPHPPHPTCGFPKGRLQGHRCVHASAGLQGFLLSARGQWGGGAGLMQRYLKDEGFTPTPGAALLHYLDFLWWRRLPIFPDEGRAGRERSPP